MVKEVALLYVGVWHMIKLAANLIRRIQSEHAGNTLEHDDAHVTCHSQAYSSKQL